ncbi:MAG: NUDIX hydrolase [Bacilli bacterium]|nr:NUDIX hydrolase [Bacilli bacterium]
MNYEVIKNEIIKFKKEELDYIDNVAKISSNKILSEYEKLETYRTLNYYQNKLTEKFKCFLDEIIKLKQLTFENLDDTIIEFDIDKKFLSSVNFRHEEHKKYELEKLGIYTVGIFSENFKFKLTLRDLKYKCTGYIEIDPTVIQNNQRLIENPIYILCGYYDYSEECYGPCLGDRDDYLYAIYENIRSSVYNNDRKEVHKKEMDEFEKDKIIVHSKRYVYASEIRKIFEEELLNTQNKTINDCVEETKNRIEELSYIRSPEYKEKVLLDRINELYKTVKGEFIKKEILYNGNFIDILKETYKLPNETTVQKEKIVKNNGKNSVIVIPITQDKEYIITFQNRIKDKIIAEFPSGYIEDNENIIEAAKRELKEETGYISDDLFIVDEAYTSPGTDNSITYIVVANNCIQVDEKAVSNTELINHGLFSEKELEYLINKNIINGAMNKLAYYNLVNNVDDCNVVYTKSNQHIYKKQKKKTNPLEN